MSSVQAFMQAFSIRVQSKTSYKSWVWVQYKTWYKLFVWDSNTRLHTRFNTRIYSFKHQTLIVLMPAKNKSIFAQKFIPMILAIILMSFESMESHANKSKSYLKMMIISCYRHPSNDSFAMMTNSRESLFCIHFPPTKHCMHQIQSQFYETIYS